LSTMAHSEGITVIAHGSDATDHPKEYLDNGVNYVLNGEAEKTLTDLCTALLQSREPKEIPGLVCYASPDETLQSAANAPKNPSWVDLPRIARELIDLEPYRRAPTGKKGLFSPHVGSTPWCPSRAPP